MAETLTQPGGGLDMTQGRPISLIFRFSLPLLLGNLLQQVYNMVDSSVAGIFVGKAALSAVSAGYPIVFMLTSAFSGVSIGGTILIAQYFGRRSYEDVDRTVRAVYFGITVVCVPLMVLGILGAKPLLELFLTPQDVLPHATTYVQVIFAGLIGGMIYNVNAGILQGLGDSKSSLRFLAISCAVNVVLDLLFVAVVGWGVFGASFATILAQGLSAWLGVRHINRRYPFIHIRLFSRQVDMALVKKSLYLGIPSSISNLQYSIGMLVIQSIINSCGTDFIAGAGAAAKIDSFAFMPILSFSTAITTYVGHNMGARRLDRMRQGVHATLALSCGTCALMALIFVPLGRFIMSLFFGLGEDPAALDAGMAYLLRIMIPTPALAVLYVLNATLRGAGAAILPTVSGIVALWVVRVPAAYLLMDAFGPENMFFSFVIGWTVGLIITGTAYLRGKWTRKSLFDPPPLGEELL